MSNANYDFPITNIECPLESINGVWEFRRPPHFNYLCYSLPGHLLHLVTEGSYRVKINGVAYDVNAGDVVYYYESEEVETIGADCRVVFYSVGFQAPKLHPLPSDMRVFPVERDVQELFQKLYDSFSSEEVLVRNLEVYSSLFAILVNIEGFHNNMNISIVGGELWWEVERRIRKDKLFRVRHDELSVLSGYSKSTLIRSCRKACGVTPMKRIQRLRMEEARGLLKFAQINVSQVAEYLLYPRVHEFSREFSKYFGISASEFQRGR